MAKQEIWYDTVDHQAVVAHFLKHHNTKTTANAFGVSTAKIQKILSTHGIYTSKRRAEVLRLHQLGYTQEEIGERLRMRQAYVSICLPYQRTPVVFREDVTLYKVTIPEALDPLLVKLTPEQINEIRLSRHESRKSFAAKIGIEPKQLYRWEHGENKLIRRYAAAILRLSPVFQSQLRMLTLLNEDLDTLLTLSPGAVKTIRDVLAETPAQFGKRFSVSAETVASWESATEPLPYGVFRSLKHLIPTLVARLTAINQPEKENTT